MGIGTREMVIFLIIVLIIFGPKNLPRLAQAVGKSVRELKKGLQGVEEEFHKGMEEESRGDARAEGQIKPPAGTSPVAANEPPIPDRIEEKKA
jgi:sec-independent protein translocase protein TatA